MVYLLLQGLICLSSSPKESNYVCRRDKIFALTVSLFDSTRVSNELGSGNPQAARTVVHVVLVISITEAAITSTTLFFTRYIFGYAFSNDKEVVDYVTEVAPLLCLSVIVDSLLAVLCG